MWTDKQKEYINNADKRWNVKVGATGTGKTYVDYNYIIPKRTRELRDKEGLSLIIGVTASTIERNVLQPMREVFGDKLVGNVVKGEGTVMLFGELYHVIGAEKENATNKIQGATVKYIYGDEFVNWNKTFFNMLTTRLRVEGAVADLTGNPQSPTHWAKGFIDKMQEEDKLFYQTSTIYDNPTLPKDFVESQEIELKGTTEYERLILGRWAVAEGSIYPMLDEDNIITKEEWEEVYKPNVMYLQLGVDIGGNVSKTSFQATAVTKGLKEIITIKERRFEIEKDIDNINYEFKHFIEQLKEFINVPIRVVRIDNAEQVIIKSMITFAKEDGYIDYNLLKNARKQPILDRIRAYQSLMNLNRYLILEDCNITIQAFKDAVWDHKLDSKGKERRLDDGTSNIDTLDAQEYSTEELHKKLLER